MRIVIDASVYSDTLYFPVLDTIALLVEEERHIFGIEVTRELRASLWLNQRPKDLAELIDRTALAGSYDRDGHRSIVIIDADAPAGGQYMGGRVTRVQPIESLIFLCTPFQLVVENEEFDGGFLLWMARALGMSKLIAAYRGSRFSFRHAGGKDSIERSVRIFSNGVWARADGKYARAFRMWLGAVLDNDSRYPGHDPNGEIVDAVGRAALFVHQLSKRAIESYLPRRVLLAWCDNAQEKQRVEALFRLNDTQRRHFFMKGGFRIDKQVVTKQEFLRSGKVAGAEKELYRDVPDADWSKLAGGFGGGLAGIFLDETFRPSGPLIDDLADTAEISGLLNKIYESI